jgi:putative acetyltransferase
MIKLVQAHTPDSVPEVRTLFKEYEASLGIDLCFQNFAAELAELPGDYAPPYGRLLLARLDRQTAGCVALRKIDDEICEMKRLYVRSEFRGKGVGRALVDAILNEARKIGYRRMRLDTLPSMKEAIALYQSLRFRAIAPYRLNPVEGALFLELDL